MHSCQNNLEKSYTEKKTKHPNGYIFVDSPFIRRQNSTRKVCGNYIDFESRIHVEVMAPVRRGYFDVDLTFKIDEILMSSPCGFFYVVATSNRRKFCTRCLDIRMNVRMKSYTESYNRTTSYFLRAGQVSWSRGT